MGRHMPVDLTILCGFLGSGKTTLLVDFLRQDNAGETGVIVNEVGEIGVDGVIVADGSDGVPMTTLANGCVCCSLRSSLVDTVRALLESPRRLGQAPIKRIILEASGLSRPGPIIASLSDPELSALGLRVGVLSTYDCERGLSSVEAFDEAAAQLVAAQRVVFTKVDRVSPDTLVHHRQVVAGVNPLAQVVADTDRAAAVALAFGTVTTSDPVGLALHALRSISGAGLIHPRVHVLTGIPRPALSWDDVSLWLDDLAGFCGDRLLRFKALLHVTDCLEPILIQSVGTTFSAPRRMMRQMDGRGVCVAITRDIDARDINAMEDHPAITLVATGARAAG
jgi:G3E family GTPase